MTIVDTAAPSDGKSDTRRIFMSYAWGDAEFARRLAARLRVLGVTITDAQSLLSRGGEWEDAVVDAITHADQLLIVVPPREGEGKNALAEMGVARALHKPIVIVTPDSQRLETNPFPFSLSSRPVVDASDRPQDDLAAAILNLH